MASLLRRGGLPREVDSPSPDRADNRTRRRFLRRQWRRRWHLWRIVLAVALAAVALGGAVWTVYHSELLSVSTIQVEGVDLLPRDAVRQAALTAGGAPMGEPLVRVDTEAIEARVESLAAVRSAEVTRVWPDQLLIRVNERQVVATVELGGRIRGMDASGVAFRDYAKAPKGLPEIRTDQEVDTDTLREAGRVVTSLPTALQRKVGHVSVESIDRISLQLRDGRVVLWGSAEESADKARVLESLLATRARSYDVSVPGLPTYRR